MKFDYTKAPEQFRSAQAAKSSDNILTPICRMSWPNLFTAKKNNLSPEKPPTFGISILIPPTFDISMMKKAAGEAAKAKWGDKMPAKLASPFLDAGDYKYEGYIKGWTLIRLWNKTRPQVVDGKTNKILTIEDEPDVYGGRWCRVSVNAYAYPVKENPQSAKGVNFGLNNVQLLDHDDALSGRVQAADDFEAVGDYDTGVKPETADSLF